MKSLTRASALGLAAWMLMASMPTRAYVPLLMPMQGALRDNAGVPVAEGTFGVTFALYTSETGGEAVWTENWPPSGICGGAPESCVKVKNGSFHVLLGTHVLLVPSVFSQAPELWLGMAVETDPELPRRRLGSTGYALHAGSADVALGLACSGCVGQDALSVDVPAATGPGGSALNALTAGSADVLDCQGCVGANELAPSLAGLVDPS